jgi:8-oxo-dGTP pyrophosphatase MutT (NUDIX family)
MAEQVRHWQRNHRAARCPRITVQPLTGSAPAAPVHGKPHVFRKRHTQISVDWPVVPGTAALLADDEGRYLLHLRSANKPIWRPGQWALLGGNTEKGEDPDEAIVREIAEETGLTIPGLTFFVTLDTFDADGAFKDRVRVYHGTLNRPAHEIPLHEGVQLRWTHLHETAEMTMDPGTLAVLRAHHDAASEGETPPVVVVREPRERSRSIVGAHLVLLHEGCVLLGKRHPASACAPSTWHLPAGRREAHESTLACVIRETAEETGIRVTEADLTFAHALDLLDPASPTPRVQLFFTASRWEGEPTVLEPDRCTEWKWWPLTALPDPIVDYTRAALEAIANGTRYSARGWN